MAKVVIDSSVAIKWFLPETLSEPAGRILSAHEDGSLLLLAPDLLYAEVGNILWKKERSQVLEGVEARRVLEAFHTLRFQLTSNSVLLTEAYRLAVAHQRTVYDALYIALSLREECPFVTADEKLVHAVAAALPNVIALAEGS
jgi:predicted nucleic acid-binding protein